MNETDIKKAAKKIQNVQTFQELHDIMVAYANLGDYKSQNLPRSPRAPDYHDPMRAAKTKIELDYEKLRLKNTLSDFFEENWNNDETFGLNKDGEKI